MMIKFNPGLGRFTDRQSAQAFTLTDLLFTIIAVGILAVLGLSLHASVGKQSSRADCANNLRQIGVAALIYAKDNADKLPYIKYSSTGSLWYPYEMMRLGSATQISMGPEGVGMLWEAQLLKDGRVFYCPANQNDASNPFTYEYYDSPAHPWPYGVVDNNSGGNLYVRSGYVYFPQNKVLETSAISIPGLPSVGLVYLPAVNPKDTSAAVTTWNVLVPMKISQMDPTKSMVTDNDISNNLLSHSGSSEILGVNALFGDGHVTWQSVQRVPTAFNPGLWTSLNAGFAPSGQTDWRYIQYIWQP